MESAKHADNTFQALAGRLRARDESLILPEIPANVYIETNEYLYTYETLKLNDDKVLLRDPDGEAEEDK